MQLHIKLVLRLWKSLITCIEGLDAIAPTSSQNSHNTETQVIQEVWQEACQAANAVLQQQTLQDLCERRNIAFLTCL